MSRIAQMLRSSLPDTSEIVADAKEWMETRGPWMATSVVAHAVILAVTMLTVGTLASRKPLGDAPAFDSAQIDADINKPQKLDEHFDIGDSQYEPSELTPDSATEMQDTSAGVEEQINGPAEEAFTEAGGGRVDAVGDLGGLSGFEVRAIGPGPKVVGEGGLAGKGLGTNAGSGGAGVGFGGRGSGVRKAMLSRYGGTKATERAVNGALHWLARHQTAQGSWNLNDFKKQCTDATCKGDGAQPAEVAATAMALLPFLAAGQTHRSKGPFQEKIQKGLYWLVAQQDKGTGNMAPGQTLYAHGLATICLCEAYALSQDPAMGAPAQAALDYVTSSQVQKGGGWRYAPNDPTGGDTSVTGWQVMALKSGKMAGLKVSEEAFKNATEFLKTTSNGAYGGTFGYIAGQTATPSMTAVGLLCTQYLGANITDKNMQEGSGFLLKNLPDLEKKDNYYWYYATQVMHNIPGDQWDTWNRRMRRILVDSQAKEGCATGSWNPDKDPFGGQGGRLYVTCLSCLTLEVYYRYLPLYKLDKPDKPEKAETEKKAAP